MYMLAGRLSAWKVSFLLCLRTFSDKIIEFLLLIIDYVVVTKTIA